MEAKNQLKRKGTTFQQMVVLVGIVCLFLGGFYGCSRKIDKRAMVTQIQKIADLATVEFRLRKIIFAKQEKKFLFLKLGTARYVAALKPMVKAGIDISQIQADDIDIDEKNKIIRVELPPVKIIDYDFNEEDIEMDFNMTADKIFNRFTLEDIEKILRDADKDIRTYLNFLGIKEEAPKKYPEIL